MTMESSDFSIDHSLELFLGDTVTSINPALLEESTRVTRNKHVNYAALAGMHDAFNSKDPEMVQGIVNDMEPLNKMFKDEELYCFCRKPDDHKFMIECENCNKWFHGKCVNMTAEKSKRTPNWNCQSCRPDVTSRIKASLTTSEIKELNDNKKKRNSIKLTKNVIKQEEKDVVRERVLENIKKVLVSSHEELVRLNNEKGEEIYTFPSNLDLSKISFEIEQEMYEKLARKDDSIFDGSRSSLVGRICGDDYKEKFRTLHFNLKNIDNAYRVLSGQITPVRLVSMTAEDFATEKLKNMKQIVEEEKLRGSVLTEQQAQVILKKTNFGREDKERRAKIEQLLPEKMLEELTSPIESKPNDQALEHSSSSNQMDIYPDSKAEQGAEDQNREKSVSRKQSTDESSAVKNIPSNKTDFLDDLLSKISADKIAVAQTTQKRKIESSTDSNSQDSKILNEVNVESTVSINELGLSHSKTKPIIWEGSVSVPTLCDFVGTAVQIGGPEISSKADWEDISFSSLIVEGRIPTDRVHKYLEEMIYAPNPTREILLLEFTPTEEKRVFFNEIFNTYHAKNRYGVIGNKKPNVKDFYLVMLSKNEDLPDFLKGVEHDLLMKNRDRNVFMGVIVITKNIVEMMTKSPKNVDNLAKEKVEKAPKRQRPSRFSAEIAVPKPVVSSTASADPRRRANVPVEVPVIPSVPVQAAPVPMFQPPQNTPSFPQPSAASVDAVSLLNSIAGSIPGFIPLPTTQQIPETQQNISGYPSMQFQNTNTFVKSQPGVNGFPNPYMNFNVPHGGPSYNMGMSQQNMHTGPLPIDPRATQKRDGTWNRHPK